MEYEYLSYVLITLVFSALFSGGEIAFISSNKLQIELQSKQGHLSGRILARFVKKPGQFIGTTLIGNTIALVLYGIFMASLLEPQIKNILPAGFDNQATVMVVQTIISTILVLITAEFIPKSIFMLNPNSLLSALSIPFLIIYYLMYPVVWFVVGLSRFFITKVLRLEYSEDKPVFKVTDLNSFLQTNVQQSGDDVKMEVDTKIFDNAVEFKTIRVRECMVPRTDIVAVEIDEPISELKEIFAESGHSKIIVYRESIDDVIGYCHQLELFKKPKTIADILTPIIIVPESALANELLIQFIQERKSLALVVDEFGGTSGIVSMEDIIEEIFGEIEDEYDHDDLIEQKVSDHEYLLSARHEIDYLNEKYNWELPYGEFETLSGLVISLAENIPNKGESVTYGPYTFTVVSKQDHRIDTLKIKVNFTTISKK
ncbi:hemolysin family protein [Belliella kenyensis]|uniref:Hemolysin family protein n=1 Tax=Belliella kenyensis TaxID=1472724 RepID=A0ABV8EL03_9BACT|nr:hemolysin family protein [Belliella kenyensis]MCH7401411.1 hemolysin family protein [Belliella kenyensis]MDN3602854.1 hemolysin family protein [Belliella kenyensis]